MLHNRSKSVSKGSTTFITHIYKVSTQWESPNGNRLPLTKYFQDGKGISVDFMFPTNFVSTFISLERVVKPCWGFEGWRDETVRKDPQKEVT